MKYLKEFPYVTYLSATPILDRYLEQIDFFSNMNYYHLVWGNKEVVKVYRERTNNPISAAIEIVRAYQKEISFCFLRRKNLLLQRMRDLS